MENTLGINTIPADDFKRVQALKKYNILNTPPEKSFNNIAKLSAQFFDLPVAFISFVDTDNVFVKASIGIGEVESAPRSQSLCTYAILNNEVTVIDDFNKVDPCLGADPVFVAELGYKFYAAAPIITQDGFRIGTVTVIGTERRTFSDKDILLLQSMANIVMDEIELRIKGVKEAEKSLLDAVEQAQSNFNNKALLANAPFAIGVLSGRELIIELANVKILEVWGKTDSVIGRPLEIALPELKTQPFLKILDEVYTTGVPFYGKELSVFLLRENILEEVFFNFVYQPLQDTDGNTVNIMIVATEVTNEIKARRLLESVEQQMEGMVMNSTEGMGIFTGRDLIVELVNQSMCDIWERSIEEVKGKSLFALFPKLRNQAFPGSLLDIFDTRETLFFPEAEVEFETPIGNKKMFINLKYVPLFDQDGEVKQVIITTSDVTEIVSTRKFLDQIEGFYQRSTQILMQTLDSLVLVNGKIPEMGAGHLQEVRADLQQVEDNLLNAIDRANLGTWFIDVATLQFTATAGLKKLFGFYPDEEMSFQDAVQQMHEDYRDKIAGAMQATMTTGDPYHVEYPVIGFHDQKTRWLHAYGRLTRNSDGQPSYFSGVVFDITEQKIN